MRYNRRSAVRADADFLIRLKEIFNDRTPEIHDSFTKNISETGLQVSSFNFFPVNTRLMLEASLSPQTEPVNLVGRVVWIEQIAYQDRFNLGIEIPEISDDIRTQFQKTIDSAISRKQEKISPDN